MFVVRHFRYSPSILVSLSPNTAPNAPQKESNRRETTIFSNTGRPGHATRQTVSSSSCRRTSLQITIFLYTDGIAHLVNRPFFASIAATGYCPSDSLPNKVHIIVFEIATHFSEDDMESVTETFPVSA